MWNKYRVVQELGTQEDAFRWCQENGILPNEKKCPKHRTKMTFNPTRGRLGAFTCNKGRHNFEVSICKGTWLDNIKLPLNKVFSIMYSFCNDDTYETCRREATTPGDDTVLSDHSICDWYNFCREVVVDDFLVRQENRGKIGGPGKVVQIDESKFGRRKYNKGRRIDGHWVLGMIEDGAEDFRMVVCPENLRDSDTLIPLIKANVAEGTEIRTDMWKAYSKLGENGYSHSVASHSDPENPFVSAAGIHTQRIEASWRPAKDWFRSKRVPQNKFLELMVEYQWRRECTKSNRDKFESLLEAIRLGFPV